LDSVKTADGERISAGVFVVACGAWLSKLFPGLLRRRIYAKRFRDCHRSMLVPIAFAL
jgi:glycine/D-amino acid oxidase-like deaminating enzyme